MDKRNENQHTATCSAVQASKFTERTNVRCTPRLRCIPEHAIQIKTPRLIDAQRGPTKYVD